VVTSVAKTAREKDNMENFDDIEPIEGWHAIVDKLLLEYGWIAYCTNKEIPVGTDVDCFGMDFVVLDKATKDECVQQYHRVLEITGKREDDITPPPFWGFWMKLAPKGYTA